MTDKYLDYFVHGWSLYMRFNRAANAEARAEYRRSIAANPKFCRAYADLAYSIFHAWLFNWDQNATLQDALDELSRAPSESVNDYYYLWVKGAMHLYRRDFATAETLYNQSWDLAVRDAIPSDLESLRVDRAEMLLLTGRAKQAIADINLAIANSPVPEKWYYWVLSWAYYADGQWQNSIDAIQNNISNRRNAMRKTIMASYAALGKDADAAKEATAFVADEKKQSIAYPSLKDYLEFEGRVPFSDPNQSALWKQHLAKACDTVLPKP